MENCNMKQNATMTRKQEHQSTTHKRKRKTPIFKIKKLTNGKRKAKPEVCCCFICVFAQRPEKKAKTQNPTPQPTRRNSFRAKSLLLRGKSELVACPEKGWGDQVVVAMGQKRVPKKPYCLREK